MLDWSTEMQDEEKNMNVWHVLGRTLSGLAVLVLCFAGVCVDSYFLFFAERQPLAVAQNWDRATAEILDYRMVSRMGYGRAHRSLTADKLEVRFAYRVHGKRYVSEDAGWYGHEDVAPFKRPRRADLGEFDCYVNPENPAEAVLFCNTSSHPRWFGWLVILALLCGAAAGAYMVSCCLRDLLRRYRAIDSGALYRRVDCWCRRCRAFLDRRG